MFLLIFFFWVSLPLVFVRGLYHLFDIHPFVWSRFVVFPSMLSSSSFDSCFLVKFLSISSSNSLLLYRSPLLIVAFLCFVSIALNLFSSFSSSFSSSMSEFDRVERCRIWNTNSFLRLNGMLLYLKGVSSCESSTFTAFMTIYPCILFRFIVFLVHFIVSISTVSSWCMVDHSLLESFRAEEFLVLFGIFTARVNLLRAGLLRGLDWLSGGQ